MRSLWHAALVGEKGGQQSSRPAHTDTRERHQAMANVAARTAGFIHTRLLGPVSCRAYGIGPAAVRLGRVIIVISDRKAALSVATAALFFEEIAPKLGPTYQHRLGVKRLVGKNDLTALVAFNGTQQIRDRNLKPAYLAKDGCGEASLTIGNVRVTVCDRDSATKVAKALADAYGQAAATYVMLRPFDELREGQAVRRTATQARRTQRV